MGKERKTSPPRLTRTRREVLQSMADGAMLCIDRTNSAYLPDRPVHLSTRYFLTEHKLIVRADPSRHVESRGNGFVITELGRAALAGRYPVAGSR